VSVSARVDVVIADGTPDTTPLEAGQPEAPETVDVAPDPNQRIIILAPTKALGSEHATALGIEPVAIVTPRSPHAAHGMTADNIIEADGLTADERQALMGHASPALVMSAAR
jgi:hypothetical protein